MGKSYRVSLQFVHRIKCIVHALNSFVQYPYWVPCTTTFRLRVFEMYLTHTMLDSIKAMLIARGEIDRVR